MSKFFFSCAALIESFNQDVEDGLVPKVFAALNAEYGKGMQSRITFTFDWKETGHEDPIAFTPYMIDGRFAGHIMWDGTEVWVCEVVNVKRTPMRRYFTQPVSDSASVVILDRAEDAWPEGRVWHLVSGLDIAGNQIYGVSYSETGIANWYDSYAKADAVFTECRNAAVPF